MCFVTTIFRNKSLAALSIFKVVRCRNASKPLPTLCRCAICPRKSSNTSPRPSPPPTPSRSSPAPRVYFGTPRPGTVVTSRWEWSSCRLRCGATSKQHSVMSFHKLGIDEAPAARSPFRTCSPRTSCQKTPTQSRKYFFPALSRSKP